MKTQTRIGLKHSFAGLLLSAIAAFTVVFAIKTYAGPVPPMLLPGAAAFSVFVVMNRRLWQSIKDSHEAGEVGRRVHATGKADHSVLTEQQRSTWFANSECEAPAPDNHASMRKKKALQTAGPEGLS